MSEQGVAASSPERPEVPESARLAGALWLLTQRLIALLLIPFAFVLVLGFAIAIRRRSRGPLLIVQQREGLGGRVFGMYKLRTMRPDAEIRLPGVRTGGADAEWLRFGCLRDDPRVVGRPGRLARRYSVDELPQLLNVVRGQMALVGPRPLPPDIAATLDASDLVARRRAMPGMTGLWQVSGRSDVDLVAMGKLDRRYVDEKSVLMDLRILAQTTGAVVRARGAY